MAVQQVKKPNPSEKPAATDAILKSATVVDMLFGAWGNQNDWTIEMAVERCRPGIIEGPGYERSNGKNMHGQVLRCTSHHPLQCFAMCSTKPKQDDKSQKIRRQ